MKKVFIFENLCFAGMIFFSLMGCASVKSSGTNAKNKVIVTVNLSGTEKQISPFIFGINDGASFKKVSPKSIRFGGNRTTGAAKTK